VTTELERSKGRHPASSKSSSASAPTSAGPSGSLADIAQLPRTPPWAVVVGAITFKDVQRTYLQASFALTKRQLVALVVSASAAAGWFTSTIVDVMRR
jgi:hypothetical protein